MVRWRRTGRPKQRSLRIRRHRMGRDQNADDPQTLAAQAARARKGALFHQYACGARGVDSVNRRHLATMSMAAATGAQIAGVRTTHRRAVESSPDSNTRSNPSRSSAMYGFSMIRKRPRRSGKQALRPSIGACVIRAGASERRFHAAREPLRSRGATVVAIGESTPLIREA